MKRLLNRFRKKKDGAAAIEFALIAPMFLLLIMGTFELALVMFYSTILEGATNFGARLGKVNPAAEGYESKEAYIFEQVSNQIRAAIPPDKLLFTAKTYTSFDNVNQPEPCNIEQCTTATTNEADFNDINDNGHWDEDQGVETAGAPGNIVQYTFTYQYRFFTPLVGHFFPNPMAIRGVTVVRNEPP